MYELKQFQVDDVKKMHKLKSFINANPTGAGKTIETLQYISECDYKTILFVVPLISVAQWKSVMAEFNIYYNRTISITHFEEIRAPSNTEKYKDINWDLIVIDEAHKLKSPKTLSHKAIKSLTKKSNLDIIFLTATPFINNPMDFWNLMQIINKSYVDANQWKFRNKYCELVQTEYGSKILGLTKNSKNLIEFKNLVLNTSIVNSQEVINNFEATYNKLEELNIDLKMGALQKDLYLKVKQLLVDEIDIIIVNALSKLLILRQLSSNPKKYNIDEPNEKFKWIESYINCNPDKYVLIFSSFKHVVAELKLYLQEKNITNTLIVSSDYNKKHNMRQLLEFKKPNKPSIMLATLQSLGESIDGLQHNCHTMIYIDKDYNAISNKQSLGRLARIQQQNKVTVYNLRVNVVDRNIENIYQNKLANLVKILNNEKENFI